MNNAKKFETDLEDLRLQCYKIAKNEVLKEIDASLLEIEERLNKIPISLLLLIQSISNSNKSDDKNIHEDKSKLFNSSLPTIPLPIFNGYIEEFNNFKEVFENLINCHTYLSYAQK